MRFWAHLTSVESPPLGYFSVTIEYIAYVDEAGDEGFGKLGKDEPTAQSRWFAIGAVVVQKSFDREVPGWKTEVLEHFPKKKSLDLHFRELKHDQRVQACILLSQKPIGACVVCSNKITLLEHPKKDIFKQRQHLYNYLTRFLLERLTAACQRKAWLEHRAEAHLKVVFSRRRGTDYHAMRRYLEFMRDGKEVVRPVRSIDWNVLDPSDILVENHSKRAGLQIADIFTSAIWHALEPNSFGFCEARYARLLVPRLLRSQGQRYGTGLTIVPSKDNHILTAEQHEFIDYVKAYR
nr:DUF3800 domain-containing protein [Rhizobium halophytocola]